MVDGGHQLAGDAGADDGLRDFLGLAALIIRGAGFLQGGILSGVLGIAVVWTATEWVRGIIFTGLPWLFLGYSQTPILPMCQIADITGAYGVTFWVMAVNALAAMAWLNRRRLRIVFPAAAVVGLMTVARWHTDCFASGRPSVAFRPARPSRWCNQTILRATAAKRAPRSTNGSISISGRPWRL